MPNQIPEQIKKERSRQLIELGSRHRQEYMSYFIGQEKEVLFEEIQEIEGISCWVGHTMEYLKVAIASERNMENQKVPVILKKICQEEILMGEAVIQDFHS